VSIEQAIASLKSAGLTLEEALISLVTHWPTSESQTSQTSSPSVRMDISRPERCGYPEVIYGAGKSTDQVLTGIQRLLDAGQIAFVTRVNKRLAKEIIKNFDAAEVNLSAKTVRIGTPDPNHTRGHVIVASAGTSDSPIAQEAVETLRWMNCHVELIQDIGVAGPQRLLAQVPRLRKADAIIVVAGMEGALPSVIAGWVSCPVVAVPTSRGYGANQEGMTALLTMLSSCASNIATVNIDSGFKGGYLAGLIAQRMHH
jgi:NCAIR mutase (PurE)-related protein